MRCFEHRNSECMTDKVLWYAEAVSLVISHSCITSPPLLLETCSVWLRGSLQQCLHHVALQTVLKTEYNQFHFYMLLCKSFKPLFTCICSHMIQDERNTWPANQSCMSCGFWQVSILVLVVNILLLLSLFPVSHLVSGEQNSTNQCVLLITLCTVLRNRQCRQLLTL